MASYSDKALKQRVRDLGATLGEIIAAQLGQDWLDKIEDIRLQGRAANSGDKDAVAALTQVFSQMSDSQLLVVARAFSQFLNLANIAEQEYNSANNLRDSIQDLFEHLDNASISAEQFSGALEQLHIDLVLTAHPTEVIRRTLIHKYSELAQHLGELSSDTLPEGQRASITARVAALISQAWHTDEIRSARPTPVDEAKWGFAVIENSLWHAVPQFIRELDDRVNHKYGQSLPLDATPVRLNSWMGGDRDGNPFVTAKVTQKVLLLARHKAATLFLQDVSDLAAELSMTFCDEAVKQVVGDANEPYRAVLQPLLDKLRLTRDGIADFVNGVSSRRDGWIEQQSELLEPLMLCFDSLHHCGMGNIADDKLLDTIRRAHCFGIHLLKLDLRQSSDRHASAMAELTRYLGLGDYGQWSEEDKQAFLLRELSSKRPLFPMAWEPSAETKEVLDTCRVVSQNHADGFGIYIISMAGVPSDILCVQLLLQEMGANWAMPVAPLFETLDDLNNAPKVMDALFSIDWYRGYVQGRQYVMIGYSDSAKDAGAIAAGWAQYSSQEALVALADSHAVNLTLFHGRGGTIGRGGLPAHAAILSQPPGSLKGGFRVTEQGETIRYKFGNPLIAQQSLDLYASAILEAILVPPPVPKPEWREAISEIAGYGRDNYRSIIREHPDFVPYFRAATPEQELGKLPLGSRPAKRNPKGGVESLRAIPWIFAWAQTRLVLPSWLGVMKAVESYLEQGNESLLKEMIVEWPFFYSRLSMLDMVFTKADASVCAAYDQRLVPDELKHFGEALRDELRFSMELLLSLTQKDGLMNSDPKGLESMQIRAGYLAPLHYLQIELLSRIRALPEGQHKADLDRAMMVTIGGIAIGMRNTG